MTKKYKPATISARAGVETDEQYGAIMPPIYLSTNYSFDGYNNIRQYDYSRAGNPTRDDLGNALAALDGGAGCVVTASGMAALDLAFQLLSPGDVILAPHDCYGGTYRLLKAKHDKGLCHVEFINQGDEAALKAGFDLKPKMILLETPSNPLLRITDIGKIVDMAKKNNTVVACDNTFLSPVCQRPLELGAEIVIHASTKYINGHGDVVGGAVIAKDKEMFETLAWWANCSGTTGSAMDSYLTLRGLRTLEVRIKRMQETTAALIDYLGAHEAVQHINYPGLPDHPGHKIAAMQQVGGFGPMFSFELNGGEEAVRTLVANTQLISLAESLGGVESLICHPATMTHAAMDKPAQEKAGITMNLMRISPGLEDPDDLISDLDQALDKVKSLMAA